ncbi:hypothetical protein PISL3812_05534 [Talaromyces islandicus]|uniref:Uncharacterized protein n=1 Tax=Talaromyces islandicus TaxID=28573 RepID=A0A0U1LYT3_TALIS|nr:hypothetical protein PISL3812_05534 [Talaromyces islandicus]
MLATSGRDIRGFGTPRGNAGPGEASTTDVELTTNLSELETYLGLVGCLRDYIAGYASINGPLEDCKRDILKLSPKAGKARIDFTNAAQVSGPTAEEIKTF